MKRASPLHEPQDVPEDLAPTSLRLAVLEGLLDSPKHLPSAYLYDARGSALFERICELPEYYPTRTELAILQTHAGDMATCIGPRAILVEPGSGAGVKTALLLERLLQPAAYVPVEISPTALQASVRAMAARFAHLPIHPLQADFTQAFTLPHALRRGDAGRAEGEIDGRVVFFFPGSTIGNLDPPAARRFLAGARTALGPGARLLVGVDLAKDPAILLPAYDDAAGVTAAFNRNLLVRLNREAGADFDPAGFDHRALWNAAEGRIEMHLVSRRAQQVRVAGSLIAFAAGESIHTENSYKHTLPGFAALARAGGWATARVWTDPWSQADSR